MFGVAEHFHAGYREPRPPIFADSLTLVHTHHDVSVDVNETEVDYFTDRFQRTCSMHVECHDDCNSVSKAVLRLQNKSMLDYYWIQ